MADLEGIASSLYAGNAAKVKELTQAAIDEGVPPADILNAGLITGMERLGVEFKANRVYVPEVLIAARAMHAGMEILKPKLLESGVQPVGKVVLGTVKGDLHDIGKNLVGMMLEGGGFEVIDVGVDVSDQKFVDTIKETGASIVALSALLTTTMVNMAGVVKAIDAAGLRDQVKIMIGGAPVTDKYAQEIGADGYGADASSAADVAKTFVN